MNSALIRPIMVSPSRDVFRRLARLITLVFMLLVALDCYSQLFGAANWLLLKEDDFFYYLKVASNLAHGQKSTYGGVATNGYHPLWLIMLTCASYCERSDSQLTIRSFLAIAVFTSTIIIYFLSRRLLSDGVSNPLLVNSLAAIVASYAMRLFNSGMEIIVTVPLIFVLIYLIQNDLQQDRATFLKSMGVGLLLSSIFLSRLDSGLLLCFLLGALSLEASQRVRVHPLGLILGIVPALAYFGANRIFFDVWWPVSGLAKQLKTSFAPSWAPWKSISHANALCMGVVAIGIILLPAVYRQLTGVRRVLYPVLMIFPFVHLLVISCLSDWPVWPWYLYSLRPALCISFSVFLLWGPSGNILRRPLATVVVVLMAFPMFAVAIKGDRQGSDEMYLVAVDIHAFAETHPGTYAMGDRAGIVGYLLADPLVQTEGLMADKKLLTLIRHNVSLRDVLKQYRADYYIATSQEAFNGCFHAIEPALAGPASPHMRADFCSKPLADFQVDRLHTFIFDLRDR